MYDICLPFRFLLLFCWAACAGFLVRWPDFIALCVFRGFTAFYVSGNHLAAYDNIFNLEFFASL